MNALFSLARLEFLRWLPGGRERKLSQECEEIVEEIVSASTVISTAHESLSQPPVFASFCGTSSSSNASSSAEAVAISPLQTSAAWRKVTATAVTIVSSM